MDRRNEDGQEERKTGRSSIPSSLRPANVPTPSNTVLITIQTYDDAGRVNATTDPRGIMNATLYDALGRVTRTIQNYIPSNPAPKRHPDG